MKSGWQRDGTYRYSVKELEAIAQNYKEYLQEKLSLDDIEIRNDFDRALSSLGRKWNGYEDAIWGLELFNRKQQVVIAQMIGIKDKELGIKDIDKLRARVYRQMQRFLNKGG